MKRLLSIFVVLFLFTASVASAATIDLSGLSFAELVALKDKINLAIWNSEKWQEVEVPKGVWIVGEDIPAGKWTIKAAEGILVHICWGDSLDESGTSIAWNSNIYEYEFLYSTTYRNYEKGDATEVIWELKNGQYFIVKEGIALFTPYAGKPSLGFK